MKSQIILQNKLSECKNKDFRYSSALICNKVLNSNILYLDFWKYCKIFANIHEIMLFNL